MRDLWQNDAHISLSCTRISHPASSTKLLNGELLSGDLESSQRKRMKVED